MEIVKSKENLEHLNQNIKDDFYKVPNLNFDIPQVQTNFNSKIFSESFIKVAGERFDPNNPTTRQQQALKLKEQLSQ